MKKQLLLAAAALTLASAANAKCWRINPNPNAKAQFTSVKEAMEDLNVYPGDTLLLDPGFHGAINLTQKNITLIGTGYFLDQNKGWTEISESVAERVSLSEGSKVEGVVATGYIGGSSNTTISRCKTNYISGGYNNSLIERCIVDKYIEASSYTTVKNNIIRNNGYIYTGQGCVIENNTVIGNANGSNYVGQRAIIEATNSIIRNNIVINTNKDINADRLPNSYFSCISFDQSRNNNIYNNVLTTPAEYADANYPSNHYVGATVENTFVMTGTEDAKYKLLETSAAKKAAANGSDCGAFGGATPYVLSGIPQFLPHITEAIVPTKPTDGKITVKLKIENQDE